MERTLNLIKTDYKEVEKRTFPRFPYSYLTFKRDQDRENCSAKAFEVKDISYSGMQLCLKDGGHTFTEGSSIKGDLHWKGASLEAKGIVKWVKGSRLGVVFDDDKSFIDSVKKFLSIENIVAGMRPIHSAGLDIEIPNNLKYWLRSDGPVEIFVWCHTDGELSRFQMVLMDSFVEWEDGQGIKTGSVLSKKDVETPLTTEDEFEFSMDPQAKPERLEFARSIINHLSEDLMPDTAIEFLKVKLGG